MRAQRVCLYTEREVSEMGVEAWKVRVGVWAMAVLVGMSGVAAWGVVAPGEVQAEEKGKEEKGKKEKEAEEKKKEDEEKSKKTKETLEKVKGMVNQYFQNNLRLPESLDLLTKEPNKVTSSVPVDAWGRAFKYRMGAYSFERQDFDVTSAGPDGKFGTADDLKVTNDK